MTADSTLLAHQPFFIAPESIKLDLPKLKEWAKELNELNNKMVEIEVKKLKIAKEEFKTLIDGKDLILDAKKAKALGAIDKIVPNPVLAKIK